MRLGRSLAVSLWAVWGLAVLAAAVPAAAQDDGDDAAAEEQQQPRLLLRGFTDVTFTAQNDVGDEVRPDTFALGQFDLFMTSRLSDSISVLGEIVFEFGEDNTAVLDVERVQVKWAHSDRLNVAVGRMHTPLGYWNETYHHGSWFQTTAARPLLYRFEDDGGILPVHQVGIQVFGTVSARSIDVQYNASVANGRGTITDEILNVRDLDHDKALNLLLSVVPGRVPGLKVGGGVYLDTIPAGPAGGGEPIDERILGGHLVYLGRRAEVLAELSHVRHRRRGADLDTVGLYVQGAWKAGHFKPFYRFDRIDFAEEDEFFGGRDVREHTFGVRWDAHVWTALKAEYRFTETSGLPSSHAATAQVAFTF